MIQACEEGCVIREIGIGDYEVVFGGQGREFFGSDDRVLSAYKVSIERDVNDGTYCAAPRTLTDMIAILQRLKEWF